MTALDGVHQSGVQRSPVQGTVLGLAVECSGTTATVEAVGRPPIGLQIEGSVVSEARWWTSGIDRPGVAGRHRVHPETR